MMPYIVDIDLLYYYSSGWFPACLIPARSRYYAWLLSFPTLTAATICIYLLQAAFPTWLRLDTAAWRSLAWLAAAWFRFRLLPRLPPHFHVRLHAGARAAATATHSVAVRFARRSFARSAYR